MNREEVLRSPEYWLEHAQNEVFRQVVKYMEKEKITQTELAARLGVTKGYVSQVLRGNFNYTLKKLIELGLAIGVVPIIQYKPVADIIAADSKPKVTVTKNGGRIILDSRLRVKQRGRKSQIS